MLEGRKKNFGGYSWDQGSKAWWKQQNHEHVCTDWVPSFACQFLSFEPVPGGIEVHDMGSRQVKSWKCNRSKLYAVMLHNAYIRSSSRKCRNAVFVQIDTNRIFSVFLCLLYPQYTVHVIIHDHTNQTIFLRLLCSLSVEFLHPPKKHLRQVAPETRFGGVGIKVTIFNQIPQEWPAKLGSICLRFLTTLQPRNGHQAFCHVAWGSCSLVFKHQLLDCQSEEVPFLLGETWLKIPKTSWMVF